MEIGLPHCNARSGTVSRIKTPYNRTEIVLSTRRPFRIKQTASLDLLVSDFLLVGDRHNSLFQIHHAGNAGDVVDCFGHTVTAFFAVHAINLEGLGGNYILQLLLSGLVITAAATAALTAFSLYDGADRNQGN